nr:interleukin 17-6 [Sepiella japonica]
MVLFGLFGSGSLLYTECKELDDLSDPFIELAPILMKNKTLLLIQNMSSSKGISNENNDVINRSACSWTNKRIIEPQLFPSVRDEAECSCKSCNGHNDMYQCEPIRTPMIFHKRICTGGRLAYEPIILEVATGCTCAYKNTV